MAEVSLVIDGMHCGACVRRVRTALAAVPGVAVREVEVGSATVELGGGATAESLLAAVARVGFTAAVTAKVRSGTAHPA